MSANKSFEFKGLVISFELLLTHFIPGFILLTSIIIFADITHGFLIINYLGKVSISIQQLILSILLLFTISTFFGFIIDAISSVTFGTFANRYFKKDIKYMQKINIFNLINTNDDLIIYKHFFEDKKYFIDAYSNIALAMLFSCFAILKFLIWFNCSYYILLLCMFVYVSLILLLYYKALISISSFYQDLMDFEKDRAGKNAIK